MKKELFILSLFCSLFASYAYGQASMANANSGAITGNSQNPSTPGSSIYSPDLFSGSVNVNIPIYSYTVDGLDLGVSLSYNTLGIKVDQVASNVGLGWNLNTGGIITRQVNGIEDELTEYEIDTLNGSGVGHSAVDQQQGNWANNGSNGIPSPPAWEEEPDLFTAVIGGRTINFCLSNYQDYAYAGIWDMLTVYTSPKKNIRVDIFLGNKNLYAGPVGVGFQYNKTDINTDAIGTNYILRFKITDEKGNQFFFDRGDYQVRYYHYKTFHPVTVSTSEILYEVPLTWVLSKVITYTGATVSYSYVGDSYNYFAYINQKILENSSFSDGGGGLTDGSMAVINDQINMGFKTSRLTNVNYPNGDVVTFNIDGNVRLDRQVGFAGVGGPSDNEAVSSIKIQSGYDGTVSNSFTYKFNYAYFNSDVSDPEMPYPAGGSSDPLHDLRLKLLGIDKIGTDGITTENYYKFGYSSVVLPARLSGITDCYGYNNGKPLSSGTISGTVFGGGTITLSPEYVALMSQLNNLSIPSHTFNFQQGFVSFSASYGRDLTPDWNYAQAGLLTSVTNGLGGAVKFTYQDHSLVNPPDFYSTPGSWASMINTGYFKVDDVEITNGGAHIYDSYYPPPYMPFPTANDGVCIASIVSSDGYNNDNTTTTTFDFSDGTGGPGGYRFFPGNFFTYPTYLSHLITDESADHNLAIYSQVWQNSFTTPVDFLNGANHGYSHARVKTTGYGGDVLSDKAYTFTNMEGLDGETVNGFSANWSRIEVRYGQDARSFQRVRFDKLYMGLLKELDEYDNAGNRLSKTVNTYNERKYDSVTAYSRQYFQCYSPSSTGGQPYEGSYYTTMLGANVDLISSVITKYSGGNSISTETDYGYDVSDAYDDLSTITTKDSKLNTVIERYFYDRLACTENFQLGSSTPSYTWNLKYLGSKYKEYTTTSSDAYIDFSQLWSDNVYATTANYYDGLGNLVPSTTVGAIKVAGPQGIMHFNQIKSFFGNTPVGTGIFGPANQILAKHFLLYDDHNNVLQTGYNNDQKFSSTVWDNRIGKKVAEVSNAAYADIAYTSFEGTFAPYGTLDFNKGNWDFNPANIVLGTPAAKAITGRYYLNITGGSVVNSITIPASGKKYLVSFWYKGAMPMVTDYTIVTMQNIVTIGDWTLATGTFTGVGGTSHVMIYSTPSSYIDELRMLPVDASMDTYTYEPLLGVSSHCDERNDITYFEYDAMGRPTITRDINGNIISLSKHVVQGSDY